MRASLASVSVQTRVRLCLEVQGPLRRNPGHRRSGAYEKERRRARDTALEEMSAVAAQLGANAIIGVDLDYGTIELGGGGGMLMVTASGMAVKL